MSGPELEDFLVLRNLDEPLPSETFETAAEGSVEAAQDLEEEGVGIQWVKSHVRSRSDGRIVGTICHFKAEDEEVLYEHADRAGLPVTRIDHHGATMENE